MEEEHRNAEHLETQESKNFAFDGDSECMFERAQSGNASRELDEPNGESLERGDSRAYTVEVVRERKNQRDS